MDEDSWAADEQGQRRLAEEAEAVWGPSSRDRATDAAQDLPPRRGSGDVAGDMADPVANASDVQLEAASSSDAPREDLAEFRELRSETQEALWRAMELRDRAQDRLGRWRDCLSSTMS